MVKFNKSKKRKNGKNKGFRENAASARKINASTPYETCTEQLSPFGGLLAMIKFFDLIDFKEIFNATYETLYGNQQGGRKGHNIKNRGKKGCRPVLCFIEQTRECLVGKLRKGETLSGKQTAAFFFRPNLNCPVVFTMSCCGLMESSRVGKVSRPQ